MNQRELRHPQDNGARGLLAFGHDPLIVQYALRTTVAVGMDHAHRASVARHTLQTHRCNRHSLLYVRANLLRRYLTETRQVLVWCNWAEKEWLNKKEGHDVIRTPARHRIWEAHSHIHRSFSAWSAEDSTIK